MKSKEKGDFPDKEITTIAKGAGIFFIGTGIGTGLKFIFELIVARKLGAESFGLFVIGFSLFKILEIASSLGVHNGILRYGALYKGEGDFQRVKGTLISSIKIVTFASVILSLIVIIFSKFIAINIFHNIDLAKVLLFFSLALPFSALSLILVFSLQSFKIVKYRVYIKELLEPSTRVFFFIFAFLLGWKLYGALFSFLISCVTGAVLAFLYLKKVFPRIIDKRLRPIFETKKLLNFSYPLLFTGLMNRAFMWIGSLIIGGFLAGKEVGFYGAANRTSLLGIMVLTSVGSIFAPIISELYNKKEFQKLETLFKTTTKWIFTISYPIFLIMIFFSKNILIIFGEEYTAGSKCLIILAIGQMISSLGGSYGYMIMMSGRSKITLINASIAFSLNISLCFILIPQYGIIGAAYASTISLIFITIIGLLEVFAIHRIHPYQVNILKPLLGGGISLSISLLIIKYLMKSSTSIINLSTGALVLLIVYSLLLYLFGISDEEKLILKKIKMRLGNLSF